MTMTIKTSNNYLLLSGLDNGPDIYLPDPKKTLRFLYNYSVCQQLKNGKVSKDSFKFTNENIPQLVFSKDNKLFKFYSAKEREFAIKFYCAIFCGVDEETLVSSFGTMKAKRYLSRFESALSRIPSIYLDEIALFIWNFTIQVKREVYTSFHKIYIETPDGSIEINENNFRDYLEALPSYFI